jgi:hypothetical protein
VKFHLLPYFFIQWTEILDKFVSLQSLILKDNTMKKLRQRLIDMAFSQEPEKKDIIIKLAKKYNILKCDDDTDGLLLQFTTEKVSKYERMDIKKLCELILYLIHENNQITLKSSTSKEKHIIDTEQISMIKSLLCNKLFMILLSDPYQYRDYMEWTAPFYGFCIKFNKGKKFVTYIDEDNNEIYPIGILDIKLKQLMRREETLLNENGKYYIGTLLFCWRKNLLNAAFFSKEVKTIRNEEAAFLYDLLGLYNIPIPEYEVRESAQDKKEYIRGELNKVHAFLG